VNDINKEAIERYDQEEKLRVRYSTDIESIENEEGRVKVNYTNGYHTIYDRVIYALGGTAPIDFFKKSGMEVNEHDLPTTSESYETSVKGLYVAGQVSKDYMSQEISSIKVVVLSPKRSITPIIFLKISPERMEV
jgi:thioredoxin reductase (NADPH)